jgi:energy-coupling factor transport system permease protein
MAGFLDYHAGTTIMHRLNPLIKILVALGVCAAAFISANLLFLLVLMAFNVLLGCLGGIGRRALGLLWSLIKVSVFLFVLQVLVIRSGNTLWLFITDEGVRIALVVVMRLIDACMPLALMLMLTQLNDLTNALVRTLRLPYKYAFTITTALRFIPIFTTEMGLIMEAQMARGIEFDTKNPIKKLALVLPLSAPLLISSVGRTHYIAMAAEVRGFYLRTRKSGIKRYPFKLLDAAAIIFTVGVILAAVFWAPHIIPPWL